MKGVLKKLLVGPCEPRNCERMISNCIATYFSLLHLYCSATIVEVKPGTCPALRVEIGLIIGQP